MGSHTKATRSAARDVRSVLDSIRRIVQALRVFDRSAEKQVGLSGAQLFVLGRLAAEPRLSLNELAERTHTHQSSVSVVVQRLVDRKLVKRTHDETDGRRLELSLTAAGAALSRRAPAAAQEQFVAALRKLSPAARAKLAALLHDLVTEAGLGDEDAPMLFEEPAGAKRVTAGKSASPRGRKSVA